MSTILVTGGAGYIGSHTTLALIEAGYGDDGTATATEGKATPVPVS